MESITAGRWMEAKILELRRNRKKEIFGLSTFDSAGFPQKSVLTEKVEKICLFVEGSLSFNRTLVAGAGVLRRVCVLFVEAKNFSLLFVFVLCVLYLCFCV